MQSKDLPPFYGFYPNRYFHPVTKSLQFVLSIWIFILTITSDLSGQELPLELLTSSDGLSQGFVPCITQDRKGFLWIGTKDGLNRYDGYHFRVFRHDPFDSLTLSDNRIMAIHEDRNGRMWVSTELGLNLYDPLHVTFHHIHLPDHGADASHKNVTLYIYEDAFGGIWAVNDGPMIYRLMMPDSLYDISRLQITEFDTDETSIEGLKNISIYNKVAIVGDSVFFLQTCNGLNVMKFNSHTNKLTYSTDISFLPAVAQSTLKAPGEKSVISGSHGNFWIADAMGMIEINTEMNSGSRYDLSQKIPGWHPGCVVWLSDESNDLVALSGCMGIALFTKSSGEILYSGIPDHPALRHGPGAVFVDEGGVLWIGSRGAGLLKSVNTAKRFSESRLSEDKVLCWKGNPVRSLLQSQQGMIFIGSGAEQLTVLNPSTGIVYPVKGHPIVATVSSIHEDRKGRIWAADQFLYLIEGDPDQGWWFTNPVEIPNISFPNGVKILEAANSAIWVLTINNLCRFDEGENKFTCYSLPRISALSGYFEEYPTMIEDAFGFLWLGTPSGLFKFDPRTTTFKQYVNDPSDRKSLGYNVVRALELDPEFPDRYLWVGTAGAGMDRLDITTGEFIHFGENEGLPDMVVYGILADSADNLWISTNSGLAVMNIHDRIFRSFDVNDGLQDNEFNSAAYYKTRDGVMLFGGVSGFNRFRPESVKVINPHIPRVAITGVRISNKTVIVRQDPLLAEESISYTKQLNIPARLKSFTLEFAAFDFSRPSQNQFAYRLEGFDPDWQYAGNTSSATYTNLDPGKYTFRVKAASSDGLWNEEGASLIIHILPPWYKSWWAFMLYVAALSGLLFFVRKKEMQEHQLKNQLTLEHVKAEKLQEIDQMKSHFFANISNEFRTPLTLIMGHLESIENRINDQTLKQNLHAAARNGKKLLQLINQLLDLSKIDAGRMKLHRHQHDVIPFLKNILYAFESVAEQHYIKLKFVSDIDSMDFAFDAEKLERIFINLLSNAIKFTPAGGEITMVVESEIPSANDSSDQGYLIISIADTGIGISKDSIAHVFDRFYQSTQTAKNGIGGTGIGLALVKELVQLHGGNVSVQSEEEKGAVFTVRLPLFRLTAPVEKSGIGIAPTNGQVAKISIDKEVHSRDKDHADPLYTGETGMVNGTLHILVVEDNPEVRMFIRRQLQNAGYLVSEAVDGADGLRRAKEIIPDLIITDVMMPVMDGYAFTRRVRSDMMISHTPVIMLTARAGEEDKLEGLETGVDAYLTKPYSNKELLASVTNLYRQRQLLRERFRSETIIKPADVSIVPMDQVFMEKVMQAIEDNISEADFGVDSLSAAVLMSPNHLHRKLTALIQQSPGSLIRSIRLQRAAELLANQACTINEIAYKVGFSVPENFSRSFKKQFGLSPSEYARANADKPA